MTQTNGIMQRLHHLWPGLEIAIEQIHTTGDRVTNVPLSAIGGDGVFVTEIERALHERRIDLAVHSLKDLPTVQPDDLFVVVVGPREDVRDVFVSGEPYSVNSQGIIPRQFADGPKRLRIGTCSLRRTAQLRSVCPDADFLPLRGNVDTRLRKVRAGEYDGIVLASAGLHRLGLQDELIQAEMLNYFPLETVLPAPGQGALALECRKEEEIFSLLEPLQDRAVQAATMAERAFMRHLGAGCYLPVAAYGKVEGEILAVTGRVIQLDGRHSITVQQSLPWQPEQAWTLAEQVGNSLAEEALAQGANQIIQALISQKEGRDLYV